jgi:glutaredoxin-like protein NrdH
MKITVYSKPGCVQCTYTKIFLGKLGLPYQDIDVTQDADALRDAKRLGKNELPVVVVANNGESQHWAGFKIDLLKSLKALVA